MEDPALESTHHRENDFHDLAIPCTMEKKKKKKEIFSSILDLLPPQME